MAHARTTVRTAAIAAVTGLPTTGARVYPGRQYPLEDITEPSLRTYTWREIVRADLAAMDDDTQYRDLAFVVESVGGSDAVLDRAQEEVEEALQASEDLREILVTMELGADDEDEYYGLGAVPVGVARRVFRLVYGTRAGDPSVLVP